MLQIFQNRLTEEEAAGGGGGGEKREGEGGEGESDQNSINVTDLTDNQTAVRSKFHDI